MEKGRPAKKYMIGKAAKTTFIQEFKAKSKTDFYISEQNGSRKVDVPFRMGTVFS